jgi:hypothetical protein
MEDSTISTSTLAALRRFLHAIVFISLLGTGAELLLVGHTEDPWQWTPLILIGLALGAQAALAFNPSVTTVRAWKCIMVLFVLGGFTGLGLHWKGKMEFKQESNPALTGLSLFWESLHSESPPPLAPAVMIQTGLLGLALVHRHPALRGALKSSTQSSGVNS